MKQFYIKLKKRIAFSCFFLIKSFKYFISKESIDDAIDVLRVCYPILPIPFFILVEYFDPIASVGLIVESFIVIKFLLIVRMCMNVTVKKSMKKWKIYLKERSKENETWEKCEKE